MVSSVGNSKGSSFKQASSIMGKLMNSKVTSHVSKKLKEKVAHKKKAK